MATRHVPSGDLTVQQYSDRINARGQGALVAVALVSPIDEVSVGAVAVESGAAAVSRLKIAGRIGGFLKKLFGKADGGAGKVDEVAEASANTAGSTRLKRVSATEGAGPHSGFKRNKVSGEITGYTEFDGAGNSVKRFRAGGKTHGGVEPPLVLEPKPGKGPGAPLNRARPARPEEIPGNNQ